MAKLVFPSVGKPYRGFVGECRGWFKRIASWAENSPGGKAVVNTQLAVLAALNTDAFTRIRENIQYYFVPFQSLWKYFEQQVNNMTRGDAGQNISMIASSSSALLS